MCLVFGLSIRGLSVWGTRIQCLGLAILLLFSSPLTSRFLINSLESRYPLQELKDLPETNFLVLLGGSVNVPISSKTRAEFGPSGDRVLLAADIYHAGKTQNILISAGGQQNDPAVLSEAAYTKSILKIMGVPEERIFIETQSGNSYENAIESVKMLEQLSSSQSPTLLVTSAVHLTRARALFCKAGLNTIGVGANRWINSSSNISIGNWFFQAKNLDGSTRVLREYLGIVVYGLAGKLDMNALDHEKTCK